MTAVYSSYSKSLFHLMRAIARAHPTTRAANLMRVKNSTPHFCL